MPTKSRRTSRRTDMGHMPARSEEAGGEIIGARERLLEATSAHMRENDTLEISLNDIAHRAGLNSALIKYYFGSKDGILLALLKRDVGQSVEQLSRLVAADLSPTVKLRHHIAGLINFYFAHPYLNRLMMRMLKTRTESEAQEIADRFLKPISEAYRKVLHDGLVAGEFLEVDHTLFYFNIIGVCDQFFSAKAVLKYCFDTAVDDDLRRRYIDQVIRIFLSGVLRER